MNNTYLPRGDKPISGSIPDQVQRRSSVTSTEFFNATLDDEAYESVDSSSTTSSRINTTASSDYLEPVTRSAGTSTTVENRDCTQFEQYEEITAAKQTSKKSALVVLVVFLILAAFGVGFGVCVALKINTETVPSCTPDSATVCPTGFLPVIKSNRTLCYSVISQTMTWYNASNICITMNSKAHLLRIDDAEENNLLRVPFESVSDAGRRNCTDGANQTWYWTAGQTDNRLPHNMNKFSWNYVDESGRLKCSVPITYTNWVSAYDTDPTWTWSWPSIIIGGGPGAAYDTYLKMSANPADDGHKRCALCEIDIK